MVHQINNLPLRPGGIPGAKAVRSWAPSHARWNAASARPPTRLLQQGQLHPGAGGLVALLLGLLC